jgi:hypothetical protein
MMLMCSSDKRNHSSTLRTLESVPNASGSGRIPGGKSHGQTRFECAQPSEKDRQSESFRQPLFSVLITNSMPAFCTSFHIASPAQSNGSECS